MQRDAATCGCGRRDSGNNDLSAFSVGAERRPYQDLLTKTHDASDTRGKVLGHAATQFLTGQRLSADTRFVQNGRRATADPSGTRSRT